MELEDFDPELVQCIATITRTGQHGVFYSDIDGTATKQIYGPLVEGFLPNCQALVKAGLIVHWISDRLIDDSNHRLLSLTEGDQSIGLIGADGAERYVNGKVVPFFEFASHLAALKEKIAEYPDAAIHADQLYQLGICVTIKKTHKAYPEFAEVMRCIANKMTKETGGEFVMEEETEEKTDRIWVEPSEYITKADAIKNISNELGASNIGLEIYGGDGDNDIEAQRLINNSNNGFAYKVCPTFAAAKDAADSTAIGYVRGLIESPAAWVEFVGRVGLLAQANRS